MRGQMTIDTIFAIFENFFLKKMGYPRPLFKTKNKFYNKLMWKNVNPVSGAGIQNHDLLIMSLLL